MGRDKFLDEDLDYIEITDTEKKLVSEEDIPEIEFKFEAAKE